MTPPATPQPPTADMDPARKGPPPPEELASYLLDANYYRLLYQLAAQQLNDALQHRPPAHELTNGPVEATDRQAQLRDTIDDAKARLVRAEAGLPEVAWPDGARDAQRNAENLSDVTAATIRTLLDVSKTRTLWRRRKLTAKQQRLLRFLAETVRPCSELVTAGALAALGDADKAEEHAGPVRAIVLKERSSYRVAYNLACYELTQHHEKADEKADEKVAEGQFRLALVALQIALRRAPTHRQRAALIAWAEKDPALAPIAHLPQFHGLLERNRVPDTTAKLPADRSEV